MRLPEKRPDEPEDDYLLLEQEAETQPDEESTAQEMLVDLLLDETLTVDEKAALVDGKQVNLVLVVPSAEWVAPCAGALRELSPRAHVIARTTVSRENGEGGLVDWMMRGLPVIGVSQSPDAMLPKLLLNLADRRVVLVKVHADVLGSVLVRLQTGPIPIIPPELDLARLGLDELSASIATGGKADATLQRLGRLLGERNKVGNDSDDLPKLEDAIEYGIARDWALSLRDDIADFREKKIAWRDVDRGCVLHGPPGTGKTLLAKMLGQACDIPTVVTSLGDLFVKGSGYLDAILKQQRLVFEEARSKAPSLLFIDELNALPRIDQLEGRNRDYWTPIVLDFYIQLDGAMSNRDGIVVVGATNRIEDIHPQLLRPGRLERSIYVGPPDVAGAERIFRHYLGGALAEQDLGRLSTFAVGQGATGAIIMEQVRAARRSARRGGRPMVLDDLATQVLPQETRTEGQIRRTAVHEAGHATAAYVIPGHDVRWVSIQSDGDSGGSTQVEGKLLGHRTMSDIERIVTVMLAGRAAEQIVLGDPTLGAGGNIESDLSNATRLLSLAYASGGLGGSLIYRAADHELRQLLTIDRELRMQVETALARLYQDACSLVSRHRAFLEALVEMLIEKRYLTGEEVRALASGVRAAPD
jgi:cell division protease FtsH